MRGKLLSTKSASYWQLLYKTIILQQEITQMFEQPFSAPPTLAEPLKSLTAGTSFSLDNFEGLPPDTLLAQQTPEGDIQPSIQATRERKRALEENPEFGSEFEPGSGSEFESGLESSPAELPVVYNDLERDIAEFLKKNPDFFEAHPDSKSSDLEDSDPGNSNLEEPTTPEIQTKAGETQLQENDPSILFDFFLPNPAVECEVDFPDIYDIPNQY